MLNRNSFRISSHLRYLSTNGKCSTNKLISSPSPTNHYLSSTENFQSIKNGSSYKLILNTKKLNEHIEGLISINCPAIQNKIIPPTSQNHMTFDLPSMFEKMIENPCEEIISQKRKKKIVEISCRKPLYSELKYRRRRMRKHKLKKLHKKMQFVRIKQQLAKADRRDRIRRLEEWIIKRRADIFTAEKFVERSLNLVRKRGYRSSDEYENYYAYLNKFKF
ncbi:hypothetical protein SNEBB_001846 [Seison nebaliae]|nr:hypothetical protein SNEBB_001846 [Seison nebaliae]